MSKAPKAPAPKPPPSDIDFEVVNPRYQGGDLRDGGQGAIAAPEESRKTQQKRRFPGQRDEAYGELTSGVLE